jgi:conjugal transfer/entry exclusion protein
MANRKQWIHGYYNNAFNEATGNWELRDSRNEALIAEGPKAAKIGKLGAAMTRTEKAWDKLRNLEYQLQKAQKAYSKAHRVMTDLSLEIDMEETARASVEGLREETRKSLLRIAKRRNIVGRHNLTKEELVNALSVD